jgi:hypothetical protein
MGGSIMSILEDKDKLTWFVNDGHGLTMYSGISEEKAREIANCYPEYSVGWESNPVLWGKAQTVKVTLDKEKGIRCKIERLRA